MKTAPISLQEYFATDITLSANPNFVAEKTTEVREGEYFVEVRLQRAPKDSEDHRWQVTLEIKHQAAPEVNFPYAFRLVLVGFFGVTDRVSPDDEERTVKIHGASVLYGMAREIVRAMTGRGPHRPVMLPTVSFYESSVPQPKQMVLANTVI
jgi:preprotein translocase subunit SecB